MNETFRVYGRKDPPCPFCIKAIAMIESRGLPYEYEDISDPGTLEFFKSLGWKTVPQIEIWDEYGIEHIGGYQELREYFNAEET